MDKIQFVLFDVGNVVTRATHAVTYAILEDLGVPTRRARGFFKIPAYAEFARGKISGAQFAQAVRRMVGDDCGVQDLPDAWIRFAHDAHIYMVDKAVVVILEKLKARGVPLAFVTTTNAWQTEREQALVDLAGSFGSVVRSHDIGMTKTDEAAWNRILMVLRPREPHQVFPGGRSSVLFVDDALVNCDAASRAGLQVHLYDPTPVAGVEKLRDDLVRRGLLG